MLETIRTYATERLAGAGEAEQTRTAHAAYFLELAETTEPLLRTADQLRWMERLAADHDNLRAALRWVIDAGDAGSALRLAAALGWFWALRGHHPEAAGWLGEALAVPGEARQDTRALAHAFHALHSVASGQIPTAKQAFADALRASEGLDPLAVHPLLRMIEPIDAAIGDDYAAANAGMTCLLDDADQWTRACALFARSQLADNAGQAAAVEADLVAAHQEFRAVGDRWGLSATLGSLATVRELRGDHAGAIAAMEEAIGLVRELGSPDDEGYLQVWLIISRVRAGDLAGARAALAKAPRGHRRSTRDAEMILNTAQGEVARRSGDLAEARQCYELALRQYEAGVVSPPQAHALILTGFGYVAVDEGDPGEAIDLQRRAAEVALPARDMPVLAAAVDGLAVATLAAGDPATAATLLGAAVRLRGVPDLGHPDVVRATEAARQALGAEAFEREYGRGTAMTRDEAIDLVHGTA
jgi:tetratricopeptide (TPR) repeat protein